MYKHSGEQVNYDTNEDLFGTKTKKQKLWKNKTEEKI